VVKSFDLKQRSSGGPQKSEAAPHGTDAPNTKMFEGTAGRDDRKHGDISDEISRLYDE
jgi:hypothetical protein